MKAFLGLTFSFFFINGFAIQSTERNSFEGRSELASGTEFNESSSGTVRHVLLATIEQIATATGRINEAHWSPELSVKTKNRLHQLYNDNHSVDVSGLDLSPKYKIITNSLPEKPTVNSADFFCRYLFHIGNWYKDR